VTAMLSGPSDDDPLPPQTDPIPGRRLLIISAPLFLCRLSRLKRDARPLADSADYALPACSLAGLPFSPDPRSIR